MWSSPCRRDGEVEKSALRAVTSLALLKGRVLGSGLRTILRGLSPTRGTKGAVKTFTFTENISYSSMLLISFLNEVKILAATISLFL